MKDWIDDFKFDKIGYKECAGCEVHLGFYETWMDLKDSILKCVSDISAKLRLPSNTLVLSTGHSLGGAVATFAAFEIQKRFPNPVYHYNFGSPRVGNVAFYKAF